MSDLHEIFLRAKEREEEERLAHLRGFNREIQEDLRNYYRPVSLNNQGLNVIVDEDGRIVFESKKDSCF